MLARADEGMLDAEAPAVDVRAGAATGSAAALAPVAKCATAKATAISPAITGKRKRARPPIITAGVAALSPR
jgi:hypothetical protein